MAEHRGLERRVGDPLEWPKKTDQVCEAVQEEQGAEDGAHGSSAHGGHHSTVQWPCQAPYAPWRPRYATFVKCTRAASLLRPARNAPCACGAGDPHLCSE